MDALSEVLRIVRLRRASFFNAELAAGILVFSMANAGEIAADAGYASEAAFNRIFEREFGCPPARYRRARTGRDKQGSQ